MTFELTLVVLTIFTKFANATEFPVLITDVEVGVGPDGVDVGAVIELLPVLELELPLLVTSALLLIDSAGVGVA